MTDTVKPVLKAVLGTDTNLVAAAVEPLGLSVTDPMVVDMLEFSPWGVPALVVIDDVDKHMVTRFHYQPTDSFSAVIDLTASAALLRYHLTERGFDLSLLGEDALGGLMLSMQRAVQDHRDALAAMVKRPAED